MKGGRSLFLSCFALALMTGAGSAAWPIAPESLKLIHENKINEKAEVWGTSSRSTEELKQLVAKNWRDLLAHLDEIPGYKENPHSVVIVIARAAEALPPLEYVDFLDRVADLYAKGQIPDNSMVLIIAAPGEKRGFIPVNAKHARIIALGKRLKEIIPPEKSKLHDLTDKMFSGDGADDYEAVSYVPQTLPGISLPNTFMARARRMMIEREREDLAKEQVEARLSVEQKQQRAAKVGSKARFYVGSVAVFLVLSLGYSAYKRRY